MERKKQFKQCCYYCGVPYVSYEHAPPEQLFKGFSCNKIQVPSCDLHNGQKSGRDNIVIKGMLISLDAVSHKYPPHGDAKIAISIGKSQFSQVKRQVKNIDKIMDQPPLTFIDSTDKTEDWMRKLTAALIFNATGKYDSGNKFDEAVVFCPTWIRGVESIELSAIIESLKIQKKQDDWLGNLNWESGWSSGKINFPARIYNFKLNFDFVEDIVFKHQFYDSLVWYVGVKTTNQTREKIIDKVRMAY